MTARCGATLLWVAVLCTAAALAEDGQVSGTVRVRGRAAVAGAQVTLIAAPQVVVALTRTDATGSFAFAGVPPGSYVHGVQAFLDKIVAGNDLLFGAEFYDEAMRTPSYALDPVLGATLVRRGRVPDRAAYRSGGVYLQDVVSPVRRLILSGAVRYSAAAYRSRQADSPIVGGHPLWPDDSLRVGNWTYRVGALFSPVETLALFANFSRGFRAPSITDLGTLGLTGSGFEVAAPDVAGMGATVGTSAAAAAVSSGRAVTQLQPETSQSYEFGVRARARVLEASFSAFINDIENSITKQALILPAGAVGQTLGGLPIVAQEPTGTVFVAASSSPMLVRANWDDARLWGLEHRADLRLGPRWTVGTVFTCVHASTSAPGGRRILKAVRPRPTATSNCATRAGRGGSSRTCTPPRARSGSRRSISKTAAPAPCARCAPSATSSATGQRRAVTSLRAATERSGPPTTP